MSQKIGVLIYTYDRVHDARINMEIIRNVWGKNDLFKDAIIVHSFNGQIEWWPETYLEDSLVRTLNPGHYEGAELLINEGIKKFQTDYPDVGYVVILAADTWCVKPEYIEAVIMRMQKEERFLATSTWGNKRDTEMFHSGMALDFFVVDLKWATEHSLFPIRYKEYIEKYSEIFSYQDVMIYIERVFALRFRQAVRNWLRVSTEHLSLVTLKSHIYHMIEREPIHHDNYNNSRRMYWENIGLMTHHDPEPKRAILRQLKLPLGIEGKRFLTVKNLIYYNNGSHMPAKPLYGSSEQI